MRRVYDYAKSKGYVLPTVFQGNYNPVARHYDTTLFPLLRELNIAFYAYSPIAGGFLVKDAQTLNTGGGQGRWNPDSRTGKIYNDRYIKPSLLEALSDWEAIAKDARVSKAALAYRWVMYNSKLRFVLPWPIIPLILQIGSPKTLCRGSCAPPPRGKH